jgi:subtilisin family serine protease
MSGATKSGSCWGDELDLVAPAESIATTLPTEMSEAGAPPGYTFNFGGSSAAAPIVSGIVGLMLTVRPTLNSEQVREYLIRNTDPVKGQDGFDPLSGHGKVNAFKAVRAAKNGGVETAKLIDRSFPMEWILFLGSCSLVALLRKRSRTRPIR